MHSIAEENPFRVVVLVLVAALALLWLLNLLRSGTGRRVWYGAAEGLLVAVPLRLLVLASAATTVMYISSPEAMHWSHLQVGQVWRVLGAVLCFFALLLLAWVLWALGRNFSTSLALRSDHTLVTSGPYRKVRHPMYTAFTLFWVGLLLVSANWFIGLTGLAAFALAMTVRTPKEEALLLATFGAEYRQYMAETGRFLPPIRKARSESTGGVA